MSIFIRDMNKTTFALMLTTALAGCTNSTECSFIIKEGTKEYLVKPTPNATGVIVQEITREENNDTILHPHAFSVSRLKDGELTIEPQNTVHLEAVR